MSKALLVCCAALALSLGAPFETRAATFDVKAFGAKADGKTLDRDAINKAIDAAAYDAAEPNQRDKFQDFGHNHWHNSLIWGDGLENVSIVGGGLITAKALAMESISTPAAT